MAHPLRVPPNLEQRTSPWLVRRLPTPFAPSLCYSGMREVQEVERGRANCINM